MNKIVFTGSNTIYQRPIKEWKVMHYFGTHAGFTMHHQSWEHNHTIAGNWVFTLHIKEKIKGHEFRGARSTTRNTVLRRLGVIG